MLFFEGSQNVEHCELKRIRDWKTYLKRSSQAKDKSSMGKTDRNWRGLGIEKRFEPFSLWLRKVEERDRKKAIKFVKKILWELLNIKQNIFNF